ncbi:MAG: helix-turn-helix domain-containing protein [Hyphomonadaceae bacterium]
MSEKSKKRGGARPGAGRKSKAQKAAELVASGLLSPPPESEPEPVKLGRPSSYKPEFAGQAEKLCRLGATDMEIADFFEVDVRTIYRWAHTFDLFCQALRAGKEAADERVERSLFNRAVGYTHEAVKIFMPANAAAPVYAPYREHVPPDVGAASLWLRNRRGEAWRDKQEHVHRFRSEQMTDDDLAAIAARGSEGAAETPSNPGKPH